MINFEDVLLILLMFVIFMASLALGISAIMMMTNWVVTYGR